MDLQELSLDALELPERETLRAAHVAALDQRLRTEGQREPIIVVRVASGRYLVLDGVRRVRALRRAGRRHATALVVACSYAELIATVASASRERWSRCDELRLAARLSTAGLSLSQIARVLGKRGVEIARLRSALTLRSSTAWRAFEQGTLSGAHLRAFARVREEAVREALVARCLEHAMTVEELEHEVLLIEHPPNAALTTAIRALLRLFVEPLGIAHLETSQRDGGLCLWIGLGPLDDDEQEVMRAWAQMAHDTLLARLQESGLLENEEKAR